MVSTHQVSKTPNPKKIYALKIDFIDLSDPEIFAEFNSEISFEVRANVAEISPENSMHGLRQGKRKRLSPENCFYGMANLNWRLLSIQPLLIFIYLFIIKSYSEYNTNTK